jgi:hypothetical protein
MQQFEHRIDVKSIEGCMICGCQECTKCKSIVKNERVKNTMFISASSATMLILNFATSLTSATFIGIGLSFGSLLSLLFY